MMGRDPPQERGSWGTLPEKRGGRLARKPNYGHQKRQREKKKHKKKAEKAEKRKLRKEEEAMNALPPEEDQDGEGTD
jgi:hypothetical protein